MTGERRERRHRRVIRPSAVEQPAPDELGDAAAPAATGAAAVAATPPRAGGAPLAGAPVLPNRAAEDCDSVWGDGSDSNDARLRENVPPHW
ncbi:MAG: hypothetical protein EOL91_08095 [Actinobacteria bacterium]|nr:hypothetical protein [Actinomycetota bacterium]